MASTLTIKSTTYGSGRYMQLSCTQKKNIADNTSTIEWTLTSTGGTSNYFSTGPTTVTINGTQVYYIARKDWTTEVFPAARGSVSGKTTIKHGIDGSKSISVSLATAIYTSTVSTYKKTWELDPIPRGATITSAPDFTDEDNPVLKYSNPAGSAVTSLMACISFTKADGVADSDDIEYKKDLSLTGTSYTFKLTEAERDVLRNNTTGTSRKVYFRLRTNISDNIFYDSEEKQLTIKYTDAKKPNLTMNVTLDNGSLPSSFNNVYVQGKSRVKVTLKASGKYNADIKSLYAVIDGKTYNSKSFTSDIFLTSGEKDLTAYTEDSRTFKNNITQKVNVIPYSKPLVVPLSSENSILCYRSDGNGKRVGGSTSVWVKAKRSYYDVNSINTCALQYRYKKSTEVWNDSTHKWADLIPKTDTTTSDYDALVSNIVFDKKTSYTFQIRAIDDIGEYDLKTFDIPTEDVALHLGKGGKNVSVGSYCDYSEEYTFHSEWKGIFDSGILGTLMNQTVEGDVLEFAKKCAIGITPIRTEKNNTNLPSPTSYYEYSLGIVHKRTDVKINVFLVDFVNGKIAVNVYSDIDPEGWRGWKYLTPQ